MSTPVKLSKANSSRLLLFEQEKQASQSQLKNQTSKNKMQTSIDTTPRGKSNMLSSMIVLHRIHHHTGVTSKKDLELTSSGKFLSMDTEPCLKLLKNQTWKDYFQGRRPSTAPSNRGASRDYGGDDTNRSYGGNSKSRSPMKPSSAAVRDTSSSSEMNQFDSTTDPRGQKRLEQKQEEMKENLNYIFKNMVQRVEGLWEQLKFSKLERKFYRSSLCKSPARSLQHCQELAAYISMLQVHLSATIEVLQFIAEREAAVIKCYDVIAAVHRRKMRRGGGNTGSSGNSNNSISASHGTSGEMTDNSDTFWKEEFISALDFVRCSSLEVIKAIQGWRRNQWRPHPFVWNGVDYLLKMKHDMNILESESCRDMISQLPIIYTDLIGVIFFSEAEGDELTKIQAMKVGEKTDNKSEKKTESEEKQSNTETESYIQSIFKEFKDNIDPMELRAAANVVIDNEALQHSLNVEQIALLDKGVFIPTLRLAVAIPSESSNDTTRKDAAGDRSPTTSN